MNCDSKFQEIVRFALKMALCKVNIEMNIAS